MAEVPRRALHCEQVLAGSQWKDESVTAAMNALEDDFTPISDMRSTAAYRKRVCRNLLKRFFLETTGGLASRVYAYGR